MAVKLDRTRSFISLHPSGAWSYEQDYKKFTQDGEEYIEPDFTPETGPVIILDADTSEPWSGDIGTKPDNAAWDEGEVPEPTPDDFEEGSLHFVRDEPKSVGVVWEDTEDTTKRFAALDLVGLKMKQLRAEYVRLSGGKKLPAGTSKAVAREAIYELRVKE